MEMREVVIRKIGEEKRDMPEIFFPSILRERTNNRGIQRGD